MSRLLRTLCIVAPLLAIAACSSPPAATSGAAPGAAAPAAAPATPPPAPARPSAAPAPAAAATALPPHRDPGNPISRERTIYFEFDSSAIDAAGRALIERHARYLVGTPGLAIRVEGHADERGSPEYNLALGQRRSEAVRRALALSGVAESRVEAVSWGEERPAAQGHDESAWRLNRRAEIAYPNR